jgi:hypothetical protein
MLVETLQAMNGMITKLANLPQLQKNQNSTNGSQNANQANLNHEMHQSEEQNLNNNHIGSANTPRSEQSPAITQFDPLKSIIDKVEAELSKIRIGGARNISFQDLCPFLDVI